MDDLSITNLIEFNIELFLIIISCLLDLLERVFLRVGSAETDEQLENVIGKFLCPVLLKLSSSEENVRKKVMELLVHFNKRVKSRPNLQLPVKDLMNLYQDPSSSSFLSVIIFLENV